MSKLSNPKDAVGVRKVSFSVVPQNVMAEVAVGMMEGAAKYGRHNYRGVGVRHSVYYDATRRHIDAFWEGQDTDPDSGLSHLTKAICSLLVWRDSCARGNDVDDRPPPAGDYLTELNKRAGEILDRHADKNPKHWTHADDAQTRNYLPPGGGEVPAQDPAPGEDEQSLPGWHGGLLVLGDEEGPVGGVQVASDDPEALFVYPPRSFGEAVGLAQPEVRGGAERRSDPWDAARWHDLIGEQLGYRRHG
jgi:hypothetical protein